MNTELAATKLKQTLDVKLINSAEFQDKYYLMDKIKGVFPDFPETVIYEAIENVKKIVKLPVRKSEFISLIIEYLLKNE